MIPSCWIRLGASIRFGSTPPRLPLFRAYSASSTPPRDQLTFSHLDAQTGEAKMVDISGKQSSSRSATAFASVHLGKDAFQLLREATEYRQDASAPPKNEPHLLQKGDVLGVAKLAGIMAAKQTSNLIPLCHPILLTHVQVQLELNHQTCSVDIQSTCQCQGLTGVEMEAMTAASVAALTVYDMCKAVDKGIAIQQVRLLQKSGGKSGPYTASIA